MRFSFNSRPTKLLLILFLAASVGSTSSLAQRVSESGRIMKQSPSEQLAEVEVGDTVAVILDEVSYRRVRGIVSKQTLESIHLEAPNGSNRSFSRSIIYAVVDMGSEAIVRREGVQRERNAQADLSRGKLLLFPTARLSSAGQATLFNSELFFPYLSYSLPVLPLEVRAGSSILPMPTQEFYTGVKAPLFRKQLADDGRTLTVSAGAFGIVSSNYWTAEAKDEIGGAAFGLVTYDLRARTNAAGQRSETTALTGGAGYVMSGGIVEEGPAFMAGFEHRQGGRFKLLGEAAYLPASNAALGSVGLRYVAHRIIVEGGLLTGTPFFENRSPVLPLLSFGYRIL